jgi:hypothetical protein
MEEILLLMTILFVCCMIRRGQLVKHDFAKYSMNEMSQKDTYATTANMTVCCDVALIASGSCVRKIHALIKSGLSLSLLMWERHLSPKPQLDVRSWFLPCKRYRNFEYAISGPSPTQSFPCAINAESSNNSINDLSRRYILASVCPAFSVIKDCKDERESVCVCLILQTQNFSSSSSPITPV